MPRTPRKLWFWTRPGSSFNAGELPIPSSRLVVQVTACGVCRTDLHVVDGDLTKPRLAIVPGHEIVGPRYRNRRERLCRRRSGWHSVAGTRDAPLFTGYQINGGYADYTVAEVAYCFAVPESYSETAAAPLLHAGLIGYRSLRIASALQSSRSFFSRNTLKRASLRSCWYSTRPSDSSMRDVRKRQFAALKLRFALWAGVRRDGLWLKLLASECAS